MNFDLFEILRKCTGVSYKKLASKGNLYMSTQAQRIYAAPGSGNENSSRGGKHTLKNQMVNLKSLKTTILVTTSFPINKSNTKLPQTCTQS